jgi:natural product biosynthesis luciferase-like monooxygenase protein
MDLSLFYFANDSDDPSVRRYDLLLEGARFADTHDFTAVWTPERHFHPFGGIYPNPSVTGAAIAAVTERVGIRAGSVVAPLHNPIRMAEEWSVVDNLSGGRVGISFASGWHAVDFSIDPTTYGDRHAVMYDRVEQVRRLWRGEDMAAVDGDGRPTRIRIFPSPVQPELPIWITSGGSRETFRGAGEIGAGVLTHLLGKEIDQLAERIADYREAVSARPDADGWPGHVVLMVHTFLGADDGAVRERVREPLHRYFRSSLGLQVGTARTVDPVNLQERDVETLVRRSFDRYYDSGALLGSVEKGQRLVSRMRAIGVDELACLIDFGLPTGEVLDGLEYLDQLRKLV